MDAYIYQAALLCAECGEEKRDELKDDCGCCGGWHANLGLDCRGFNREGEPTAEGLFDSDEYPKGPFADGGGEADSPQHCDFCGKFLENPLTADGEAYVRALVAEDRAAGRGDGVAAFLWADFYGLLDD